MEDNELECLNRRINGGNNNKENNGILNKTYDQKDVSYINHDLVNPKSLKELNKLDFVTKEKHNENNYPGENNLATNLITNMNIE